MFFSDMGTIPTPSETLITPLPSTSFKFGNLWLLAFFVGGFVSFWRGGDPGMDDLSFVATKAWYLEVREENWL
jgi:hypothetical protein